MKIFNPLNQIFGFTSNRFYFLLSLFLLSCTNYSFSQLAFPTAEGFGKNATGGRGGQVIIVTNLNDSGSGSLRAALDATVPRTIVFEVGGTINLNSNIYVSNGDLTLAGQTAPGDGILIKGGMVQFEESNVIVRYIKFRPGPTAPSGYDAVSITAWAGNTVEDIIFDHCSFSWGGDENFNIRGVNGGVVKNITLQNSIVSESTYGFLAGNGCFNISVYKNLFALNSERNIRSNYPVSNELDFEMINNVVYGFRVATKPSLGVQFSVLNNHYKLSSQINPINNAVVDASSSGGGNTSQTHAYISGNIKPISMTVNDSALNPYLETTAYESSGIIPIPASELVNELINNVGASLPTRDAVDIRIIDHFNNGDGTISSSGEYPTILNGTALADTDNDGMPNVWEIENGLNINDASDRNDIQEDGYTNLEYYINFMSLILETNHIDVGSDVSICEGDTTTLTATGADSYVWMPGNFIGESIDVSPSNDITYTVTGTFSDGSSLTDTISVIVNPNIIANAGDDTEICQGSTVTLAAEGGSSYQWNTGETTQSIEVSPDTTTTYLVEVFNNGCSDTDEVVVFVNDIPTANAGDDVVLNEGESTLLTATGGDSYLWSTGATTSSITVSPDSDTTYTVTVTLNGCESTDQVTVFINASVNADAGEDVIICLGSSTILTATGGSSYQWNTGETTQSIEVSPEMTTTYSVEVFNAAENNSDIDEVEVVVNDIPTANAGDDTEICQGSTVTLAAEGGSSYQWNTGETTQSIEVSPDTTTTYLVEVFNNGCSDTDEVVVFVNDIPTANAGDDVVLNEGESTLLTATGGDSYLWSTGATTSSITVSPDSDTTYTVTVTLNGCESTDQVTVFINASVNADAGEDVIICLGSSTILTATGGSSYQWNTGETTQSIEVSPEMTTTYSVEVFNAAENNSDMDEVEVVVNDIPTANAGDDTEICQGSTATLTAEGGSSYQWNTGETTQSIEVSPDTTTTYLVEVFNNGCSDTDEVVVFVNDIPTANAGDDVVLNEGESTLLTATGGDSYLWSTGATTSSITVSPDSDTTYTVTVTLNGCESTDQVTVFINASVNADAGEDVIICLGSSTILTATGGSSYQWNTGETTQSIEVSPEMTTTYSVEVFNAAENNSDIDEVEVVVNDIPTANAGDDTEICQGSTATLTAEGGSSYQWNTGETTQSIEVSPDTTTTYSVEVFNNGCSDTDEIEVVVNETPTPNAGSDLTITEGETVVITATGGESYIWNTGETTPSISVSPLTTTEYSVEVIINNCGATDVVIVFVDELSINADAGDDVTICQGDTATLSASGGDSYLWSTGETTQTIEVSPNQTTAYTVIAYSGSISNSDEVIVDVGINPEITLTADSSVLAGNYITLSASGANNYEWSNGATQPNIAVSPNTTTTYVVTGYINNCYDVKDVTVSVVEQVEVDAGEDLFICQGETITLTANGSGAENYYWNTGETSKSITVSPTENTSYSVVASNSLDSDADDVMVNVQTCQETLEEEEPEKSFNIYYNYRTSSTILNIKLIGWTGQSQMTLHDIAGKLMFTETFDSNAMIPTVKTINTERMSSGVYILSFQDSENILQYKRIVIR